MNAIKQNIKLFVAFYYDIEEVLINILSTNCL